MRASTAVPGSFPAVVSGEYTIIGVRIMPLQYAVFIGVMSLLSAVAVYAVAVPTCKENTPGAERSTGDIGDS